MGAVIGLIIAALIAAAGAAKGASLDVPPVVAGDFVVEPELASQVWAWLAGEGLWAGVVVAVVALVYKLLRPYIVAKVSAIRLDELYNAIEAGVVQTYETYTKEIKRASADGKLTAEEAATARAMARDYAVYYMQMNGVDILKQYGMKMIDGLIEYFVGKSKAAALRPLPELGS